MAGHTHVTWHDTAQEYQVPQQSQSILTKLNQHSTVTNHTNAKAKIEFDLQYLQELKRIFFQFTIRTTKPVAAATSHSR